MPDSSVARGGMCVQPLGVGLPYLSSLPPEIYSGKYLDFVEITPETLARERRNGSARAIDLVPEQLRVAREICGPLPIVVHGVELSIGSAQECNRAYLEMLDGFQTVWPFLWHSEHLGFQTIPDEHGETIEVGVPLPLPPTREAAEIVAARSAAIQRRYGVPFLLENPAHYLQDLPADSDIGDDIGLLCAITAQSGCFVLLDLHNVYCNAVNLGWDAFAAIDRMPLDRVVEIHLAGGSWQDGFWMDAHDGRVPEPVWQLLEYTLPRAPNVAGLVFEMLEEHAVQIGESAICEELEQARRIWRRFRG